MDHVDIEYSKIKTAIRDTKKSLLRLFPILAVRRQHEKRGRLSKGLWANVAST